MKIDDNNYNLRLIGLTIAMIDSIPWASDVTCPSYLPTLIGVLGQNIPSHMIWMSACDSFWVLGQYPYCRGKQKWERRSSDIDI